MECHVSQHGDYMLAKLIGPIDETAEAPIRQYLRPLIAGPGHNIIIDLSDSDRINSAGIGILVAFVAAANAKGHRIVICNVQPYVAGVFAVTKLDQFFGIVAGIDEAAEALSKSEGR